MSATAPLPSLPTGEILSAEPSVTTEAAVPLAAGSAVDDAMLYEPVVEKWSRKTRMAFIVAATAGLWFVVARLF